jgi:hypothetical protein
MLLAEYHPQNKTADTVSSLLFAIIVATLVHLQYTLFPHPPRKIITSWRFFIR